MLVSRGEGRKDAATGRVSGRARDGRLVHVATGALAVEPGDMVWSRITSAAPHHLVADAGIRTHRRWHAADRHDPPAAGGQLLSIGARPVSWSVQG